MKKTDKETLEAKLRNSLTPAYGLADMVLLIDKNPAIIPIIIKSAKQVVKNKNSIDTLLKKIEAQHDKKN